MAKKIVFVFAFLFFGCTSKSVYVPKNLTSFISYGKALPQRLVASNLYGASMNKGGIVTEQISQKNILKNGHLLINADKDYIITADLNGEINVFDADCNEILALKMPDTILVATYSKKYLAAISIKNEIFVVDVTTHKILHSQKEKQAITSTNNIAAPIIQGEKIIFGTLDSKIIILDGQTLKRSFVVSTKEYFSNIKKMILFKGKIVVLGGEKIFAFDENGFHKKEMDAKFIIADENNLYALNADGKILILDEQLNIKRQTKFMFAKYSGATLYKDRLLVLENSGYMISLSKDLSSHKTYELPDNLDDSFFLGNKYFYYGKKIIDLESFN